MNVKRMVASMFIIIICLFCFAGCQTEPIDTVDGSSEVSSDLASTEESSTDVSSSDSDLNHISSEMVSTNIQNGTETVSSQVTSVGDFYVDYPTPIKTYDIPYDSLELIYQGEKICDINVIEWEYTPMYPGAPEKAIHEDYEMPLIKILNTLGIYNFRVADEGVVIMTGGVAYVYNCYDKLFYNADAVTLTADQFELYSDKVVWTDEKIAFMRDDGKVIAFNAKDTERVIMFSPTLFTKIPVGGVGGRTRMDESDIYFAGGQFGTFCKEELGVVYSRTEKQVLITKQ